MRRAAARKIQGAVLVIMLPKGASITANSTASGTATKAATMPPETILRSAMWGTPSLRSMLASCSSGVASVSPGMPSSAVGTACVMCLATAPARKKVNTPAGGTPSSTTSRVSRSEEHTSELQSPCNLVCRLLLEKKKNNSNITVICGPAADRDLSHFDFGVMSTGIDPDSPLARIFYNHGVEIISDLGHGCRSCCV